MTIRQPDAIMPPMAARALPLSEQIREAVRSSGLSMLAVARGAEIDRSTMSKFLSGERGLSMSALDRLGEFLDLRIVAGKRRKERKG